MKGHRQRPQKKRFFLGCEGQSEIAYAKLLDEFAKQVCAPAYLDIQPLFPGAGAPLPRIRLAVKALGRPVQKRRERYAGRFILLDRDQIEDDRRMVEDAERLAGEHDIKLIWQEPCHEALLLRHLSGHAGDRPPTCENAGSRLRALWPEYEKKKPMSAADLSQRVDRAGLRRAAAVEPGLREFLDAIGLDPSAPAG